MTTPARNAPPEPYSPLQIRMFMGLADQFATPIDKTDKRWVWRAETLQISTFYTRSTWFGPTACAQMGYTEFEKSYEALIKGVPGARTLVEIYQEQPHRMAPPVIAFREDGTIDIGSGRHDLLIARHLGWGSVLCVTARWPLPVKETGWQVA